MMNQMKELADRLWQHRAVQVAAAILLVSLLVVVGSMMAAHPVTPLASPSPGQERVSWVVVFYRLFWNH